MEFIYDGSHLFNGEIEEERLFSYTNGISLWMIFNNKEKTTKCVIKLDEAPIAEFKKITEGEAFIQGMELYAKKQGEIFVKIDKAIFEANDEDEIRANFLKMQREILELKKEKNKMQKLSEKLIKGIMKDKAAQTEQKIQELLLKHVEDL